MSFYSTSQQYFLQNFQKGSFYFPSIQNKSTNLKRRTCAALQEDTDDGTITVYNFHKPYLNKAETLKRAASRLQSLLSGLNEEEDEIMLDIFKQEAPEIRLLVGSVASGVVVAVVTAFSVLCGNDPLGGCKFDESTLISLRIGCVAATIPVILRLVLYSPRLSESYAIIKEYTNRYIKDKSLVHGKLPLPYGIVSVLLESFQQYVLLVLGIIGCVESSLGTYFNVFQANNRMPHNAAFAVALLIACIASATHNASKVAMSENELNIILNSVKNSQRYYRMLTFENGPDEAMYHAFIFKEVAMQYVLYNKMAIQLSALMGSFDMIYAGVLWKYTGNFIAPLTVGFFIYLVEYLELNRRES